MDPKIVEVARTCHEEAGALATEGRLAEAAALYERALSLQRVDGSNRADVAAMLHDLAVVRERMGCPEEARALWAEARRILEG